MKLPLGSAVGARQIQPRRALATGKLHRSRQLPFNALTQHRGAQGDVTGRDGFHVNGYRQVGQGKTARLQRRAVFSNRHAVKHNVASREFIDHDLAGQQRRAAPIQRHIADRQPDALIIGDRHLGHGCLGRQRAGKAGNRHYTARRG